MATDGKKPAEKILMDGPGEGSTKRDATFLIIKTEREAGTRERERAGGVVGGKESVKWRKYESGSEYPRKYEKIVSE